MNLNNSMEEVDWMKEGEKHRKQENGKAEEFEMEGG